VKCMSVPVRPGARYIVFSDCHRGDGSAADEFAPNSLIYKCALGYYLRAGFTYIELGDAEELWENRNFEQIYITHTSVYDLLRRFHDPDPAKTRYIKVFGNHDDIWKKDTAPLVGIFPGIEVYEAVILKAGLTENAAGYSSILLLHGHQADPVCSGLGAKASRFLVENLWSGLQRFGIGDPTRAAENPGLCNRVDETLYAWAKQKSAPEELGLSEPFSVVVAGHTHRPVFENLSLTERRLLESGIGPPGIRPKTQADPVYYNTGSCVHPRSITGLEITDSRVPESGEGPDDPGFPRHSDTSGNLRPARAATASFGTSLGFAQANIASYARHPKFAKVSTISLTGRLRFTLVKWGYSADEVGSAESDVHYPLSIRRTVLEEQPQ
jgi:UDP-2,3-diacylglucosamine pyrophosphatase LpxH